MFGEFELKTTKQHFEIFKKECQKWIEIYGLKDWKIHFFHENWDDSHYANIKMDLDGRIASINLESAWEEPVSNFQLKQIAFHEVSHLFFGRLEIIAKQKTTFNSEIDEEIHAIIRTLENTLYEYK